MKTKKQLAWRYSFAAIVILLGIILNIRQIGKEFLGFGSTGNWLIYVGFVMLAVTTLQTITKKKKIVDERMEFVAAKSMRITFLAIVLIAFLVMIADGITTITIPYSYFMSYFICAIILINLIAYKILLKFY